jgi:hypothetical protein
MVPSSRGYIDMDLLLMHVVCGDLFLALYHSSISGIRQQNLPGVKPRLTLVGTPPNLLPSPARTSPITLEYVARIGH